MKFEGQYLTYEFYKLLGGSLDIMPFNLIEFKARKQVDKRTQNRLKNVSNIPNEVKLCMFNLVNQIEKYANAIEDANNNVASETTDGYSVSYITASNIQEIINSRETELNGIINDELFGVVVNGEHLIYNGVR